MAKSSIPSNRADGVAASMDGVGLIDGIEYIDANDRLAEIHGYRAGDSLVGREWQQLYDSAADGVTASELLAQVRKEGKWHGRALGHTQDGERIPVELSMQNTARGIVCVVRDLTSRKAREHTLERYETILNTIKDGVYVLDEEFCFSFVNSGLCEMTELSREDLIGRPVIDLFEHDDEIAAVEDIRQRIINGDTSIGTMQGTVQTSEGRRTLEARFRLHLESDGEFRGSVGVVRDVTGRGKREQQLERQRDEFDTLNRINELLLAIAHDLFESPMDADIEQTVCSRLAESDLYQFAWIGRPEAGGTRLVPRACAGIDNEYVESVTVTTQDHKTGQGPGGRAFRTGDIQVSQNIETDPTFEPWRDAATDRDVRSAAAVPLTYDETTYGILAVYASRPLAFSRREQRGFEILGEAIGYAINATKTRRLLFAERISELRFDIADTDAFLIGLSHDLGCSLSLESYVSTSNGEWVLYLTVSGHSAERFSEAVASDERVRTVTPINDRDGDWLVGLTAESSLLDAIAAVGGDLTAASVDSGRGRITIEVPQSTDVRAFVDQVQTIYPDAVLVSRTNHERSVTGDTWLTEDPETALTKRQREALEAAFRAGYFEWPRDSSAAEVAALLDIARPTLHAHLRKAEKELLSQFFQHD